MTDRDQLTPREVADRTGFSYHAILRAIKRGDLEAFEPVAGRLRIEYDEYERWRKAPRQTRPQSPGPRPRRRRSSGKEGFRAELDAIKEEAEAA